MQKCMQLIFTMINSISNKNTINAFIARNNKHRRKKKWGKMMEINIVLYANEFFASNFAYFTFNLHVCAIFHDSLEYLSKILHLIFQRIFRPVHSFIHTLRFCFDFIYSLGACSDCAAAGIFGVRHLQAFLLFLGLTLAYAMRVNLSVAIVAITDKHAANPDFDVSVPNGN